MSLDKTHFTPAGLLRWCYLFSPDNTSQFKDDKYKVELRLYGDDAENFKKLLDGLATDAKAAENSKKDVDPRYTEALDKDKNVIPGAIDVKFKSKSPIHVLDGKKNRLTEAQVPGYKPNCMLNKGVVAFKPVATKVTGKTHLVLYLQAVQILEAGTNHVDLAGFEEVEDGFVADNYTPEEIDSGVEDEVPDFAA